MIEKWWINIWSNNDNDIIERMSYDNIIVKSIVEIRKIREKGNNHFNNIFIRF